jgi:hypothetical protein
MKRLGAAAPTTRGSSQRSRIAIMLVACLALGGLAAVVVDRWHAGAAPALGPAAEPSQSVLPGYGCCPRTPAGAVRAVGIYLTELGGPLGMDPAATGAALGQIADPGARDQLAIGLAASRRVDEGLWGVQSAIQQGKHVVLTQTPIAYRVTSYSDQVATVAVWLVITVGVENRQRLAAFFANGDATVVWLGGAWRLHAITNGSSAADVVPACLQTPTPTGGVPTQLDGFAPYGG